MRGCAHTKGFHISEPSGNFIEIVCGIVKTFIDLLLRAATSEYFLFFSKAVFYPTYHDYLHLGGVGCQYNISSRFKMRLWMKEHRKLLVYKPPKECNVCLFFNYKIYEAYTSVLDSLIRLYFQFYKKNINMGKLYTSRPWLYYFLLVSPISATNK